MGHMLFYLLFSSSVSFVVFCLSNTETFIRKQDVDCHPGDVVLVTSAPSVISCTYLCLRSTVCKGVSYNSTDSTCTGCGVFHDSDQVDKQGRVFFESATGKYIIFTKNNLIFHTYCWLSYYFILLLTNYIVVSYRGCLYVAYLLKYSYHSRSILLGSVYLIKGNDCYN